MPPRRILHVVGGMNPGGAETWLMNVLRGIDREQFRLDFLVHTAEPGAFDDEIRAHGSELYRCTRIQRPMTYSRDFRHTLAAAGPFDAIHSHVHHYSGFILRLAAKLGIRQRIAHSHTDWDGVPAQSRRTLSRRIYLAAMKRWIKSFATCGLACSKKAAAVLFGTRWSTDPRWRVLYCGIDIARFELQDVERDGYTPIRKALGIPEGAFVLGHVGRFDQAKNQTFVVDVARQAMQRDPHTYVLFVGEGPLLTEVKNKVAAFGMSNHVLFLGNRRDVPELMIGAMDFFLFPSQHEGLGLAYVESQAAGLPSLVSQAIPEDADIIQRLVQRISLSESAEVWADAVFQRKNTPRRVAECQRLVAASPFNLRQSIAALEAIYAHST